jgi:Raf kinase inhibitor-like YbhB/YbcL family protein
LLENLPDAIGHALVNQRAGIEKIAFNVIGLRAGMGNIGVKSVAFVDHGPIPPAYTADGEGISPPLQWDGLPAGTASIVLMVEDADSPTPQPLVHAIVVELSPRDVALGEGALPSSDHDGLGIKVGENSYLRTKWLPPDPPPGHGVHRYVFQVFALSALVSFSETPGREEVLDVLRDKAIASGMLIGTYERPDGSIKNRASVHEVSSGATESAISPLPVSTPASTSAA